MKLKIVNIFVVVLVLAIATMLTTFQGAGVVSAYANTTNVTMFVTVSPTCGLVTSSSVINFGSLAVGVDSGTIAITINNTGSTNAATVNATGSAWFNLTADDPINETFPVSRSHFNGTSPDINWGESMALVDSVPGVNVGNITNGLGINVSWEVNVPPGTTAQVYQQNVTYASLC